MLPVIYSASSSEFSSNGLGVLTDCLSCKVTEERNGIFEMELTYPSGGQHADKLVVDAIIKATAHKGDEGQLFRIYEIEKDLNGNILVRCQHISYQLSFIPCSPFTSANIVDALVALRNHMESSNDGFTFWTNKTTQATIKIEAPTSTRSVLGGMEGSILDTYRGEYEFDNKAVKLWNNRGQDRGVVLRYGKNITDISQEQSIADTYTGLRPFYYDGDELVELATSDKCQWGPNASNFPYPRIMILDVTSEFSELTDQAGDRRAPTPAELLDYANQYIADHDFGVPKVSVDVSFEALWDTPEYESVANLETVNLCDTVTVKFESLDINVSAEVVKTVYDTLMDRYLSLTIGSISTSFTDSVRQLSEKTSEEIKETRTALERAQDDLTSTLLGTNGGYKVEKRNGDGQIIETLYMDTLDESTATKIWKWNINGLGYSSNGAQGPYTIGITKDGEIVADFITTGTLTANLIKAGILSSNNGKYWLNMATGEARLQSGQIGGWKISSDGNALYNDVVDPSNSSNVYRVYLQPPLASAPDSTWVVSCQKSTNGGSSFGGQFVLYSNGKASFGNGTTVISESGFITVKGASSSGVIRVQNSSNSNLYANIAPSGFSIIGSSFHARMNEGLFSIQDATSTPFGGNSRASVHPTTGFSLGANGQIREMLTPDGLYFKNASGTQVAQYASNGIFFTSTSLPNFSGTPQVILGIEPFADGGQAKWANIRTFFDYAGSASYGRIRFPAQKIQIAWRQVEWTGAITNAWGSSIFESTAQIGMGNWYNSFSATPAVAYSASSSGNLTAWVASAGTAPSATAIGSIYLERGGTTGASQKWVVKAIGIGTYS